jgi:hypothetical protein
MSREMRLLSWAGPDVNITLNKIYKVSEEGNFCGDNGALKHAGYGKWVIDPKVLSKNTLAPSIIKPCDRFSQDNIKLKSEFFAEDTKDILEDKPKNQADRHNTGKSQLSLILEADVAIKGMCSVFEFGVKKYSRGNWKKGLPENEIIDSLLRHLMAYYDGEILDSESGLPHIDHVTCNAVFLATFGNRHE